MNGEFVSIFFKFVFFRCTHIIFTGAYWDSDGELGGYYTRKTHGHKLEPIHIYNKGKSNI